MHLDTTLRTPAHTHTHRLRANRQREAARRRQQTPEQRAANRQRDATRRQQETTEAREARCVCIRPWVCVSVCVHPSCARWLVAKRFVYKTVFAASSSSITLPTAGFNLRLHLMEPTSQACSGQTACCCRSAGRQGCRASEARERGCSEAKRPGEFCP